MDQPINEGLDRLKWIIQPIYKIINKNKTVCYCSMADTLSGKKKSGKSD